MKKIFLSTITVVILLAGATSLNDIAGGPTQPGTGTAPTSVPQGGPTQPGTGT